MYKLNIYIYIYIYIYICMNIQFSPACVLSGNNSGALDGGPQCCISILRDGNVST